MTVSPLPWLLLAIPACAALALALWPRLTRTFASWLAGCALLGALGVLAAMAPTVFSGLVPAWSCPWLPQLGLAFSLRVDALAWMFAMMISGVGALVVLYAHYYLGPDEPVARFLACLLLFAASMLGVVISGNLLLLVVFWELTSLTSFLLVGFWNHQPQARRGARMALTVTGLGGLALLGGVLLIGQAVGSLELDVVLGSGDLLRAHPHYLWILGLVLLGAFTKSAQFPFHFWLPHAMAAPTPVSAFLHSATLVKAGVFLLARFYPVLADTDAWLWVVSSVGLTTLLFGSFVAIFQHDLKGLLAYSTLSHLGLITLLFGLESPLTVVAALFHILNHATFKASLFMAAGIIDHETGTRDMRRLHGLMRHLPWTGALAIVAASAMAGVPLLNGFLSKELFFAETLRSAENGGIALAVPIGALLAGIFAVAYSLRFVHDVFFGSALTGLQSVPHEPPRWMKVPVEVLVLLCVAVGCLPALTVGPLLQIASTATLGTPPPPYSLALWHGFNGPLAMSACALLLGASLYFLLYRRHRLHHRVLKARARDLFDASIAALIGCARWTIARLNPERLRVDLRVMLLLVVGLAAGVALTTPSVIGSVPTSPIPAFGALMATMLLVLVGALLRARGERLTALLLLGAIGLLVSLSFVFLSAPDLALTQLLVEVASVLLLLLLLPHLPERAPIERWQRGRVGDVLIASVAGLGMGALCFGLLSHPTRSISEFFLTQALPAAGGHNVVNVIIVDFRGLDTLGEMTVFAVAALAIHALVGMHPASPRAVSTDEGSHPALIARGATLLLPFALLVALYLLIRGHNEPGGGFIAGLVVACALTLHRLAVGGPADPQAAARTAVRVTAAGLGLAASTALAATALGFPLLTSYYQYWKLPLLEKVPLASVFLFDTGVFLVVAAGTVLALDAMARAMNMAESPRWNG